MMQALCTVFSKPKQESCRGDWITEVNFIAFLTVNSQLVRFCCGTSYSINHTFAWKKRPIRHRYDTNF